MRTDYEEMDVFRDVTCTFNLMTYITGTYVWQILMRQKISVSFTQNIMILETKF